MSKLHAQTMIHENSTEVRWQAGYIAMENKV